MANQVILCVDDEKIVLDSLKRQIKGHFGNDFLYETAENADEAFELIEELNKEGCFIIIIVSDWLMPGIKGDEFLIRIHKKFPGIVKIMLTGQADESAIEQAKQNANLHCCLHKPWREDELIETIKTGLNKL